MLHFQRFQVKFRFAWSEHMSTASITIRLFRNLSETKLHTHVRSVTFKVTLNQEAEALYIYVRIVSIVQISLFKLVKLVQTCELHTYLQQIKRLFMSIMWHWKQRLTRWRRFCPPCFEALSLQKKHLQLVSALIIERTVVVETRSWAITCLRNNTILAGWYN